MASLRGVTVESLVAPGCRGGQGGVVQEEDSQGQDLLSHRLPVILAVLDAVVQEHRAQGRLHRRLGHPGEGHEYLLLGVESPTRYGEVSADHPDEESSDKDD